MLWCDPLLLRHDLTDYCFLQTNVARLKAYKSNLILFPRRGETKPAVSFPHRSQPNSKFYSTLILPCQQPCFWHILHIIIISNINFLSPLACLGPRASELLPYYSVMIKYWPVASSRLAMAILRSHMHVWKQLSNSNLTDQAYM